MFPSIPLCHLEVTSILQCRTEQILHRLLIFHPRCLILREDYSNSSSITFSNIRDCRWVLPDQLLGAEVDEFFGFGIFQVNFALL